MSDSERIIWKYYDFNYDPLFLFNKIEDEYQLYNLKPVDNLSLPFTLDQLSLFLEVCSSLIFFMYKNGLSKNEIIKHFSQLDDKIEIESYILIKRKNGFNCVNSVLSFLPGESEGSEITLDTYLKCVHKDDLVFGDCDKVPLSITKRAFKLECSSGPFSEEEVKQLKYYPKNVGYDIEQKSVILKNFRISKVLSKEDYPLYINIPYIRDYIEYGFSCI